LIAERAEEIARRKRARKWWAERLRCPVCKPNQRILQRTLRIEPTRIDCRGCGATFPQNSTTLNMIAPDTRLAYSPSDTPNVSAHAYEPWAQALIDRVTAAGGVVLDCGAGSRARRIDGVVNLEIVEYASTDVLAFGEALRFANDQFDGVLSLAVLEHVRDPFACARELVRVAKPGASIVVSVPFLQPVHGYPDHYYNMTTQGLLNLFGETVDVADRGVPLHGHPIWALRWLAREYLEGLPAEIRAAFASLTVEQVASLDFDTFLGSPAVTALSPATTERIACLNTAHLQKKA
jgi:SAM-dependent methyltransferase